MLGSLTVPSFLYKFQRLFPQAQMLFLAVITSALIGASVATQTGNPIMGALVAYNNLRSVV